jgi:hypothetical protein
MANYVMVAAGQCGNQLCYELMNQIECHLKPDMYFQDNRMSSSASQSSSARKKKTLATSNPLKSVSQGSEEPSQDQQILYDSFFRETFAAQSGHKSFSRIVALDTEPKVIDDCVMRRKQATSADSSQQGTTSSIKRNRPHSVSDVSKQGNDNPFFSPWRYDTKSIAFRHGGAGNNWSLGYSLAQGDFLETILDCIRRQLELADITPHLVFCHSLAGGTGSGLGTRITECAADEFPECVTTNIVVAPYHFGEVVVQHYNALLCLSKIQACSQSVILLENEMAQVLCKQMRGIERPLLSDLNCVLANHITPLFLPKIVSHSPFATIRQHFSDDALFLASHPAYRFLNIKLTPQTSKQSVDFTFDQWPALFKTIQRMQLSGAYSERNIAPHIKRMGLPGYMSQVVEDEIEASSPTSASRFRNPTTPNSKGNDWQVTSPSQDALRQGGMIRSVASVLSCHGESASQYLSDSFLEQLSLQQQQRSGLPNEALLYDASSSKLGSRSGRGHSEADHRAVHSPPNFQRPTASSSSMSVASSAQTAAGSEAAQPLFDEYITAHHSLLADSGVDASIRCNYSPFLLHEYKRSVHVVANDQSMLPILRRATMKSERMFRTGAYLHQYAMYDVETADFIQAFYDIGSVIQNYEQL